MQKIHNRHVEEESSCLGNIGAVVFDLACRFKILTISTLLSGGVSEIPPKGGRDVGSFPNSQSCCFIKNNYLLRDSYFFCYNSNPFV